tara:strand:+ start:534 stop:1250 length:717 start_codon:yes stop_codon:yes gene_type:complete
MEDPIVPFDLMRMFFGTDPALFYLEIVFRTFVIYAYALLLIRWVGGRGIAQMSVVEFLLVIALGSAVGDAMFYPEVPILHAMLVITIVVLINKFLDVLIFHYKPIEKIIDGVTSEVVSDGVINMETLRKSKLGKSELFEGLREQGIANLGAVRKAYLESSGRLSTFRARPPRPGLPIEPAWSVCPPEKFGPGTVVTGTGAACCKCGTVIQDSGRTLTACPRCGNKTWTHAVLAEQNGS